MTPVKQDTAVHALPGDRMADLLGELVAKGFTLIGPTLNDTAIELDEIDGVEDLPTGWTCDQEAGYYRVEKREDKARFGYASGPTSVKRFLYPPRLQLFQAKKEGASFKIETNNDTSPRYAFVGVRPCDLHAIAIQDKVFIGSDFTDPDYKKRRNEAFIVAVNCLEPSRVCFCASMNTGPSASSGYDLLLTELIGEDGEPNYLIEAGSKEGAEILEKLSLAKAENDQITLAKKLVDEAANKQERAIETEGLVELLKENLEHPYWEDVSERCLTCANCTMACPTCFCTSVEDHTDLLGEIATRDRVWDSCFQESFSFTSGRPQRSTIKSRYRQWLTHKLSSWQDQFGTLGCVGCGRCITWCPVGIDLTESARMVTQTPATSGD